MLAGLGIAIEKRRKSIDIWLNPFIGSNTSADFSRSRNKLERRNQMVDESEPNKIKYDVMLYSKRTDINTIPFYLQPKTLEPKHTFIVRVNNTKPLIY
jgi:hypothetical protein